MEVNEDTDQSAASWNRVLAVNIWDRQRRQWIAEEVPLHQWRFLPMIPIVFYTGRETWETPLSVKALMDLPGEMERFIPVFESLLLRLKETSPKELTKSGHPFGYLLRVMQKEDAAERELAEAIEDAVAYLGGMADDQQEAWEKAIYYLYLLVHHRRRPEEGKLLKEKIAERVSESRGRKAGEEMAETLAQQLMEQGEKRGILKGIVQDKQDVLLRQMAEKFGAVPPVTSRRVRRLRSAATLEACCCGCSTPPISRRWDSKSSPVTFGDDYDRYNEPDLGGDRPAASPVSDPDPGGWAGGQPVGGGGPDRLRDRWNACLERTQAGGQRVVPRN